MSKKLIKPSRGTSNKLKKLDIPLINGIYTCICGGFFKSDKNRSNHFRTRNHLLFFESSYQPHKTEKSTPKSVDTEKPNKRAEQRALNNSRIASLLDHVEHVYIQPDGSSITKCKCGVLYTIGQNRGDLKHATKCKKHLTYLQSLSSTPSVADDLRSEVSEQRADL